MDTISVKVPLTVKAKLTDKLRNTWVNNFTKTAEQMDLEIKQLNIDRQRELNENPDHVEEVNRFFNNEIGQRQQRRAEALSRKSTIEKLPLGAEVVHGQLERQVELKVGDNLREIMGVEILIEDDEIIAIRG